MNTFREVQSPAFRVMGQTTAGMNSIQSSRRIGPLKVVIPRFSADVVSTAGVYVGVFMVYFLTMAPTVYGLDSAEFSVAAYKLGVPHTTGYPLYVLLGKLFTLIPLGDIAYRVNLMSAVFGAGTIALVHHTVLSLTGRHVAALAAALTLAFSYYFWSTAVVAEVYTLHGFLTMLSMFLLFRWRRTGHAGMLYAAGFVWGLSFGNHMTTALFAPVFAVFLIATAELPSGPLWCSDYASFRAWPRTCMFRGVTSQAQSSTHWANF